jgi:RNA polymerase sigma factor (sigma-70 family)
MADVQLGVVLRHVRKLVGVSAPAERTDGQLLDRFVRQRDEAAFEALLARHGPLVLGVCRRLLADEADAADAFQATFLVLVRRAGSVRRSASLGSWLYGVAYRVALKMRRAAARRRAHEGRAAMTSRTDCTTEPAADDLRPLLDEELNQLPEKYRAPLIACYLQGHTHAEVARQLGWPLGSVARRLARGLELLRGRLARRGLALSVAGVVALLGHQAPAVPLSLAQTTLRAAALLAVGKALTGAVSAPVLSAVEGTMRDLLLSRFKLLALLMLGLCAAGAGVVALGGAPPVPETPAPAKEAPQPKPKLDADGEPLPAGALARLGSLRLRHGSPVASVAFSPDGKRLATGSWDNLVRIWDPTTGDCVRAIHPQDGWIWAVAFSPDNELLATAGDQRSRRVRLWNVATGKLVRTFEGHGDAIHGLSYAPDGKTIASASYDGTVRLWEAATGKELRQINAGAMPRLSSVAFSPDGKTLATTDTSDTVSLWEAETGKGVGNLSAAARGVVSAVWSKDGKQIVAGFEDGNVSVWDVASARELHHVRGREMPALSVAFAPDGKTFAAGYGDWQDGRRDLKAGGVVLWDTATGKVVRRFEDYIAPVQGIAFAPDGKALAAVTLNSSVLLWDPATGKPLAGSPGHQAGMRAVAFAAGRVLLTAGYDRTIRQWDLGKHEPRAWVDGKHDPRLILGGGEIATGALAVSRNGRRLAWGGEDGTVRLCDATTGREEMRFEGHTGHVWSVAFSADGTMLASGGADKTIRLWDTGTGKELHQLQGHTNWVLALAFAPSGRLLASGSLDKSARLWDVASGKELRKLDGHVQEVSVVAFSPDGRTLATASRDDSVRLWEVATGQVRWQCGKALMGRAAAAFSPDGRLLLTAASQQDRGLRLWDLTTGQELCNVWGHRGFVTAVAFASDGKTAASVSDDSTALLWDVASLRGSPARPAPPGAAELETLWTDLLGDDAVRAFAARGTLAGSPKQALPLLKGVLRPVPTVEPARLKRLLKELDDDDFDTRERATAELEKLTGLVDAELRQALEGATSAELRERLKKVLDAAKRGPSPEALRQTRALEVLEAMGTPEAKSLLQELAKGAAQAELTREARAALTRLGD